MKLIVTITPHYRAYILMYMSNPKGGDFGKFVHFQKSLSGLLSVYHTEDGDNIIL